MLTPVAPYPALILWHDAHGDATEQVWRLEDATHAPLVMETLGWVVREDDLGITAFTERVTNSDGTYSWRGRGFIPRGMVVAVRKLTVPRRRAAVPPVQGVAP